jgi:SAM-dependent methyltransferase
MATDQPPAGAGPLASCLCTQARHESAAFRWWAQQMREPHRLHRKQWEFCYIAQALFERGKLAPGRRGLGFAVGKEPLPALFARLGCHVVATDTALSGAREEGWTETKQLALLNEWGVCPPEQFRRQVSFRHVDRNDVPDDLTGFDFVWSSCAFERLGSIRDARGFIDRMTRCLKPGGVAVLTTGFNLSSNWSTPPRQSAVVYRRGEIQKMIAHIEQAGHRVEPLVLDRGDDPADHLIDRPPYHREPHLKTFVPAPPSRSLTWVVRLFRAAGYPLEPGGWAATSLGLIVLAAGGQEQETAPPLRKSA